MTFRQRLLAAWLTWGGVAGLALCWSLWLSGGGR